MRNSKRNTNKHTIAALVGASMIAANALSTTPVMAKTLDSFPSDKAIKTVQQTKAKSNPTLKPVNAKIYLDGKLLNINDRVLISPGYRTYLPLRSLAQALGKNVNWNQQHHIALLESNGTTFELPLYRNVAIKDGEKTIDIDSKNKNTVVAIHRNKTYLPIRFESECLGYNVTYFDTDKAACLEIHLTTAGKQAPTKPTNPKPAKPSNPNTGNNNNSSNKPSNPTPTNKPTGNQSSSGWDMMTGGATDGWDIPGADPNDHAPRPDRP